MKKILVLVCAVMAAVSMSAQVYVGGTLGFSHEKIGDKKTNSVKIMPEIGYSFSDQWAVGATLGYQKGTYAFAGESLGDAKVFQFAPYARYTFYKNDLINLFVDGTIGYANVDLGEVDADAFEVALKPGLAISLSKNFSIVAKYGVLGYQKLEEYKSFGLNLDGNALSFGFYYNF